jgi:hypothetical protein
MDSLLATSAFSIHTQYSGRCVCTSPYIGGILSSRCKDTTEIRIARAQPWKFHAPPFHLLCAGGFFSPLHWILILYPEYSDECSAIDRLFVECERHLRKEGKNEAEVSRIGMEGVEKGERNRNGAWKRVEGIGMKGVEKGERNQTDGHFCLGRSPGV